MMMTDEWVTVIEEAQDISSMLLSSETVEAYRKAYIAVYSDERLSAEIREFAKMKEQYEEVQRFGRYHPDYNIVMKKIRLMKRELDTNEKVAALRLAENDVQDLLTEISSVIASSVSESIKVPTGNPFFDSSCGGGCGSGGSCSCSA